VIEGSRHTISAPATQSLGGVTYAFRSWSDGGARVHDISAASAATYTAEYGVVSADLALTSSATRGGGIGLTFFLRVRNNGPPRAHSVVLTATLPRQVSLNHVAGSSCTFNPATDFLRCPLRSIGAGKLRVVRVYTWLTSFPPSVVSDARVRSSTADPKPANNHSRLRFPLG
jgi:hypothetical protein